MPRRSKTYHYIYRTTCLVTGKFYVGMHSTDVLDDGYLGSGKVLRYSINKHGKENHRREILEQLPSREALKLREKEIVNEALLADPLCMNLKYGGEGGWDAVNASGKNINLDGCRKGGLIAKARCMDLKIGWFAKNRPGRNDALKKVSDQEMLRVFREVGTIGETLIALGLSRTGGSRRRLEKLINVSVS